MPLTNLILPPVVTSMTFHPVKHIPLFHSIHYSIPPFQSSDCRLQFLLNGRVHSLERNEMVKWNVFYRVAVIQAEVCNHGPEHNLVSTGGFSKTKLLRFEHTSNTSNTAHANTAYHSNLCSHSTLDNVVCRMHRMCRLC